MQKRFRREVGSLDAIHQFVADFMTANAITEVNAFDVELIIEELFTNMIKYRCEGVHDVAVELERRQAELVIRLADFDVEPFDPTQAPPVDTTLPPERREIGGLGLHLVRSLSDSVAYEYEDRTSRITVIKRLQM
jgi:anti-sigma regulatory factor (Ser/Thr protein kinase)